jgi:hypothetical protein
VYELSEPILDIGQSVNASVPIAVTRLFGTATASANSIRKGVIIANNSGVATIYVNLIKRNSDLSGAVSTSNWLWSLGPGSEPVLVPAGNGVDLVILGSSSSGSYTAKEIL